MQQLCHGSAFSNQFHIIETIELHRMNDETLFLKTVSATICRCVGYRQVWEVQHGLAPHRDLRDRGICATRQLAKRQITWIGNTLRPRTIDCLSAALPEIVAREVSALFD